MATATSSVTVYGECQNTIGIGVTNYMKIIVIVFL